MAAPGAPACADLSALLGEPLAGTAPEGARITLLVPHFGAMAREPLDSDALLVPRAVIEAALAATPGSRFHLFAREPRGAFNDSILVARTERSARSLHRFDLAAVTGLDALTSMLAAPERGEPLAGPLHLVCVHGRRDVCCARLGTALHAAFKSLAEGRVLKASHLGGHRFAPIVHTFPQGFCFGRVRAEDLPALDEAAARGEVFDPAFLRGVFPYDAQEQAALVRYLEEGGALRDVSVTREDDRVRVTGPSRSRAYLVERRTLAPPRPVSCGAEPTQPPSHAIREDREPETR